MRLAPSSAQDAGDVHHRIHPFERIGPAVDVTSGGHDQIESPNIGSREAVAEPHRIADHASRVHARPPECGDDGRTHESACPEHQYAHVSTHPVPPRAEVPGAIVPLRGPLPETAPSSAARQDPLPPPSKSGVVRAPRRRPFSNLVWPPARSIARGRGGAGSMPRSSPPTSLPTSPPTSPPGPAPSPSCKAKGHRSGAAL